MSKIQRMTLMGREYLLLPCSRVTRCHLVLVEDVLPHTLSLGLNMKAMTYVAQQHQPQVIAGVIAHRHTIFSTKTTNIGSNTAKFKPNPVMDHS